MCQDIRPVWGVVCPDTDLLILLDEMTLPVVLCFLRTAKKTIRCNIGLRGCGRLKGWGQAFHIYMEGGTYPSVRTNYPSMGLRSGYSLAEQKDVENLHLCRESPV